MSASALNREAAELAARAGQECAALRALIVAAEARITTLEGDPGVSTYAALTDAASADLPAINTPLADALAARPLTTEMDTAIAAAITALVGGAPGALDTLNELAAALGDDEAFATSVTNALAAKGGLAANNTWTGTNQFVDGFQWTDATVFDVSPDARDNFAAAVGTTAGALLMRLANPAADSYLRVNADGTVSVLTAAQVWTALGGSGTIGSPTFTAPNIGAATGTSMTVTGTVTTGGSVGFQGPALRTYAGSGWLLGLTGSYSTGVRFQSFVDGDLLLRNVSGTVNAAVTLGNLTASGGVTLGQSTVATLPTASSNTRQRWEVTDASGPTVGATVAGGGAAKCTVRSDGTNWVVIELL